MRMTKTEARRRADGLCRVMRTWSIHNVRPDATVVFEIDKGRSYTLIEFAPEHWAAFDAMSEYDQSLLDRSEA